MSQKRPHKRSLSKGILDMKFMKRSKEKVEKEIQDKEGAEFFGNEIRVSTPSNGPQFMVEHSMVPIEALVGGRMSFKGMNPDIERLMEQEWRNIKEEQKALERERSNQPDISDLQMANHLGKTMARKFGNKNGDSKGECSEDASDNEFAKIPSKRPRFIVPTDD